MKVVKLSGRDGSGKNTVATNMRLSAEANGKSVYVSAIIISSSPDFQKDLKRANKQMEKYDLGILRIDVPDQPLTIELNLSLIHI